MNANDGNGIFAGMKKRMLCVGIMLAVYMPAFFVLGLTLLPQELALFYLGLVVAMSILGLITQLLLVKAPFFTYCVGMVLCVTIFAIFFLAPQIKMESLTMIKCFAAAAFLFVAFVRGAHAAYVPWFDAVKPEELLVVSIMYGVTFIFLAAENIFGAYTLPLGILIAITATAMLFVMNRFIVMNQINRTEKKKLKAQFWETSDQTSAQRSRDSVRLKPMSGALKRQNNIWAAVALIISLVIMPLVMLALNTAGGTIVGAMNALNTKEVKQVEYEQTAYPDPQAGRDESAPLPREPNWMDNFLESAAFWFGIAVIIFLLLGLIKNVRDFYKEAFAMMTKKLLEHKGRRKNKSDDSADEAAQIYTEVIENIEMNGISQKKRQKASSWNDLPNEGERVRYLYRALVRRASSTGYKPRTYKTAYETMAEIAGAEPDMEKQRAMKKLADSYNSTRYAARPPRDGFAAETKASLKL